MSNNLNLDQMASHQTTPEVTHNTSNGQLDAAVTEQLSVDLTAGNVALTALQYRSNIRFFATNATAAPRDVTLQAIKRLVVVESDAANTKVVNLKLGSTTIVFNPGDVKLVVTDGTANGLLTYPINPAGQGVPFDVPTYFIGKPIASQEFLRFMVVRPFTLPINLTGSLGKARVAATASTTFTINQNGGSIGTFNFAAAATVATFSFAAAVTFAVGDIITIASPGVADATLQDIALNLKGTR